jgi:Zn-dependent alcohol dehydrogenase
MKSVMPEKKFPVILGYDAAGTIDAVGDSVTKFKIGCVTKILFYTLYCNICKL